MANFLSVQLNRLEVFKPINILLVVFLYSFHEFNDLNFPENQTI